MKCEDFMTFLPMAPDGLSADVADAFHQHIEECAECGRQWKQHQVTLSMLHSLDDDLVAPTELGARWADAIKTEARRTKAKKNHFQNRIIGLAASAILVLGTILMREGVIFQQKANTANEPMSRIEAVRFDGEASDSLLFADDSDTVLFLKEKAEDMPALPFAAAPMDEAMMFDSEDEYSEAIAPQALPKEAASGGGDTGGVIDPVTESLQVEPESTSLFKRSLEAFRDSMRQLPGFFGDVLVFISYIAPYAACVAIVALMVGIIQKTMKKKE